MKNLLLILTVFLAVSCGSRDEEPTTAQNDGYTKMTSFGPSLSRKTFDTYNGQNPKTTISFSNMGSGINLTLAGVDYSQPETYTNSTGGYYLKINGSYAKISIEQSVNYPASTTRKKFTFTGFPTGSGSYEMQERP